MQSLSGELESMRSEVSALGDKVETLTAQVAALVASGSNSSGNSGGSGRGSGSGNGNGSGNGSGGGSGSGSGHVGDAGTASDSDSCMTTASPSPELQLAVQRVVGSSTAAPRPLTRRNAARLEVGTGKSSHSKPPKPTTSAVSDSIADSLPGRGNELDYDEEDDSEESYSADEDRRGSGSSGLRSLALRELGAVAVADAAARTARNASDHSPGTVDPHMPTIALLSLPPITMPSNPDPVGGYAASSAAATSALPALPVASNPRLANPPQLVASGGAEDIGSLYQLVSVQEESSPISSKRL